MKKIYYSILLVGLTACGTPGFFLTTEVPELESETITGEVHQMSTGYGTHSTYTIDNFKRPLLIPVERLESSGFVNLNKFLADCNAGKFGRAKKNLLSQNLSDPELKVYMDALLLHMRNKHTESLQLISTAKTSSLALEFELLKIDNELELKKNQKLYKSIFARKYQDIMDRFELDEEHKALIHARIKQLRYS